MHRLITLLALTVAPLASHAGSIPAIAEAPSARLLADDLVAFVGDAARFSPRDAAARWLRLYDRTIELWEKSALDVEAREEAQDVANQLLASLPPPVAWPELSRQIENRPPPASDAYLVRHGALRLMGKLLDGTPSDRELAMQSLRDAVTSGHDVKAIGTTAELVKLEALIGGASDAAGLVHRFERQLEELVDDYEEVLEIPDLYRLTNVGHADALVKTAVTGWARLALSGGAYTDGRIVQLARQHVSSMAAPHFELITDESTLDLYEAMAKRFPDADPVDPARASAHRLLLARALRRADVAAAGDALKRLTADEGLDDVDVSGILARYLEDVEWTAEQLDALVQLLSKDPGAPLWDVATRAAIHLKQPDRVLELLRHVAAADNVAPSWQDGLRQRQWRLLLAIDRRDEAVALMRQQLKRPHRPVDAHEHGRLPRNLGDINRWTYGSRSELASSLAKLAVQQGQRDWLADAIAAQKACLDGASGEDDVVEMGHIAVELARSLSLAGKPTEAVRVLAETSSKLLASDSNEVIALLPEIALLYAQSGRYKDVVELLDQSEDWFGTDLVDVAFESVMDGRLFGTIAAESLWRTGNKADSLKAYEHLLQAVPDAQGVYVSLLETTPPGDPDVMALLKRIREFTQGSATLSAHEAEALRRAGYDEQARSAALASLRLWPSDAIIDGETTLHQARQVLAALHTGRRDTTAAAEHQSAVKAAELVMQAEAAAAVGLGAAAIDLYEKALASHAKWPEARARLAGLYLRHGNAAAAREQAAAAGKALLDYPLERMQRDAELATMFDHPVLRDTVVAVAEERREEDPGDANAMFLLGLSHWAAGRTAEAAVSLRGVPTAESEHLAAWELRQWVAPTVADRSDAALQVLAIDHDGSSMRVKLDEVIDLKRLWTVAAASPVLSAKKIESVYPLKATAAAWGEVAPRDKRLFGSGPGRAIARTRLMRALRSMMFRWPPTEL